MKKVDLKNKKYKAIIYCRGVKLNPKSVLKQELFCKNNLKEKLFNLIVPVKTFSEIRDTSPIHRPIFQEMINYSKKKGVEIWIADRITRIVPKKAKSKDLLLTKIYPILKKNNLRLLSLSLIEKEGALLELTEAGLAAIYLRSLSPEEIRRGIFLELDETKRKLYRYIEFHKKQSELHKKMYKALKKFQKFGKCPEGLDKEIW
jgi:hypothetical protein